MTVQERNEILETADILRALGGQNGFSNLQPKIKRLLLEHANNLKTIVENDITNTKRDHEEKEDLEMTY